MPLASSDPIHPDPIRSYLTTYSMPRFDPASSRTAPSSLCPTTSVPPSTLPRLLLCPVVTCQSPDSSPRPTSLPLYPARPLYALLPNLSYALLNLLHLTLSCPTSRIVLPLLPPHPISTQKTLRQHNTLAPFPPLLPGLSYALLKLLYLTLALPSTPSSPYHYLELQTA